jgi:DNA-binding transcriptional LysR family regulator
MVDLKQVHSFLILAEELHFGRAAARLRIAQPALSQQLKRLEKALGVRLVDRTSRSVVLTAPGRALVETGRTLLADADRTAASVRSAADGKVGVLRVGFSASGAFGVFPAILRAFRAVAPDVAVEFHDGPDDIPFARIESGQLDVAIVRGPVSDPRVRAEVIQRERICLVVPSSHRFASRKHLWLASLRDEEFVMFPRARAPHLHDSILSACRKEGFMPRILHEAAQWQVLVSLVAADMGITLVPDSVRLMPRAGVAYIPIVPARKIAELSILCNRDQVTAIASRFISVARQVGSAD